MVSKGELTLRESQAVGDGLFALRVQDIENVGMGKPVVREVLALV
jgi:hypothetical protein